VPLLFEPLARLFLKRVPLKRGERVLDVACGTGIVARLVASEVGECGQVTGIDISADMLRVAGANTPGANTPLTNTPSSGASIQWRLGDAAKLPVEDEAFDLVLCQQGFQYFPDQAAALREMYRALAPGGRLALCVARSVEAEHQPYQWAKFKALTLHVSPEAGQNARRLAPFFRGDASVLMKMIVDVGFQNPEVEDVTIKVQMGPLDHFIHEDVFPDLANDAQTAVVKHIHKAMEPYMNDRGVEIPYGMHVASALKA
jgi:ubiquinone/menaquinone biosynthesis C-methylase UbiE